MAGDSMSANINQASAQDKLRPLIADAATIQPMVHLDCGDFGLLVPSRDLVSLLAPQQIIARSEQLPESCASVDFDGQRYPVFCLNKALQLQSALEAKHRALVLLCTQGYGFGVACYALTKLDTELKEIYPVPPSMSSRKQPFSEFALVNDQALGLSSAAALLALLKLRGVKILPLQDSHSVMRKGAG